MRKLMRRGTRKTTRATRKGGRPRKTVRELALTGGYRKNPGRLAHRLGIVPPPQELDPEQVRLWDEFFADDERDHKHDRAYAEAQILDRQGKPAAADKILLKAGVARDVVERRRAHLDWKGQNP
jgi:hypothetical protein